MVDVGGRNGCDVVGELVQRDIENNRTGGEGESEER